MEKAKKESFFHGVKREFKKITWPQGSRLVRETIAVSVTTLFLGAIIKIVDMALQLGISFLVG